MKALVRGLAYLVMSANLVFAQTTNTTPSSGASWSVGDNQSSGEIDVSVFNAMSASGATPDAIKLSCRITTFDAPEIDISIVSTNLAPTAAPQILNVNILRKGGATITIPMFAVDGSPYAPEYRWATQDQAKIASLDSVFPQMSSGPITVSTILTSKGFTIDDTGSFGASVELANNVVHDCLAISIHARTEAAGMTNLNDLEVLEASADDECRSSPDANGQAACDERRQYMLRLNQLGQCFGEQSQDDADMRWQACDKNSNRADP